MSNGPENLTLRYLRQLTEDVADMKRDLREQKERLSLVEEHLGLLARSYASTQGRLDRVDVRPERIERRLDLQEAHP